LKEYVNLFSDINFSAVGSVTARKLAEKVKWVKIKIYCTAYLILEKSEICWS
jgi:hypothetical protein